MKKNLKKLVSVLMMLVLAMSLMACGSKTSSSSSKQSNLEELSAEELISKVSEASKEVKGVSMTGNISGKIAVSGQEMEASVDLEAKANVEPMNSYFKADINLNVLGEEQSMTAEMYEITGDDAIDLYANVLGEWSYESSDLPNDDDTAQIMEVFENIDYSVVSEYFDKIEVKTSGDYYNLVFEVSSANLFAKIEDSILASALEDVDTDSIPDTTVTLTVSVDGKTFLPKTVSLGIDMDSFEVDGMEYELSDFVFELTFKSFDSVEITVPDEALEAKENGSSFDADSFFE